MSVRCPSSAIAVAPSFERPSVTPWSAAHRNLGVTASVARGRRLESLLSLESPSTHVLLVVHSAFYDHNRPREQRQPRRAARPRPRRSSWPPPPPPPKRRGSSGVAAVARDTPTNITMTRGTMAISSLLLFFIMMTKCSITSAQQSLEMNESADRDVVDALLKTCIDDSDCRDLDDSAKFACFAYLCYPWKEDSMVPKSERRTLCRTHSDCDLEQGEQCYRHRDRRNVNKGLCFNNLEECSETGSECSDGKMCCGTYCCEATYFKSYAKLPCTSHISCQDLHLGDFCCPMGEHNETSVCCDEDPNPPPVTTLSPEVVEEEKDANSLTNTADLIRMASTLNVFCLFGLLRL